MRSLAFPLLALILGCSSSTTGTTDGGGDASLGMDGSVADASAPDAPGVDAPGTDAAAVDAGPIASWDSCAMTSACSLVPSGCCPTCGMPTLTDVDAINTTQTTAHFADVCPAPVPCPRCATGLNASLVASCDVDHCKAFDLTMLPLSACTADSDCIVRYANCCGCGGDASVVVSIRGDSHGALDALLCDPHTCPLDCVPRPDPAFVAVCDPTTNHCAARAL